MSDGEWHNTKTGTVYKHVEPVGGGFCYVTNLAGSRYLVHAEFVKQRSISKSSVTHACPLCGDVHLPKDGA